MSKSDECRSLLSCTGHEAGRVGASAVWLCAAQSPVYLSHLCRSLTDLFSLQHSHLGLPNHVDRSHPPPTVFSSAPLTPLPASLPPPCVNDVSQAITITRAITVQTILLPALSYHHGQSRSRTRSGPRRSRHKLHRPPSYAPSRHTRR